MVSSLFISLLLLLLPLPTPSPSPSPMRGCGTYAPVLSVAAIRLQREVVLNLLLQLREILSIQALQHALRVLHVQLVVPNLLVVDRLGWVDEAQRDGEPVDGLGPAASDAQRGLLLRLLQHEAVFVGDPRLFCCIGRPFRGIVIAVRPRVGRALCGHC